VFFLEEDKFFIENLEQAIEFLNGNNNLALFEDKVKSYMSSNADLNIAKYLNFQLELNMVLGNHIGVLFNYLKSNVEVPYSGRHKEVFRRLSNLRKLSQVHFILVDNALTNPNALKGVMVSHSGNYPTEALLTLTNNNNEYFQSHLNFDNMLSLTNAMLENMIQRFRAGNNNINSDLYNKEFKTKVDNFMTMMDNLFLEQSGND